MNESTKTLVELIENVIDLNIETLQNFISIVEFCNNKEELLDMLNVNKVLDMRDTCNKLLYYYDND